MVSAVIPRPFENDVFDVLQQRLLYRRRRHWRGLAEGRKNGTGLRETCPVGVVLSLRRVVAVRLLPRGGGGAGRPNPKGQCAGNQHGDRARSGAGIGDPSRDSSRRPESARHARTRVHRDQHKGSPPVPGRSCRSDNGWSYQKSHALIRRISIIHQLTDKPGALHTESHVVRAGLSQPRLLYASRLAPAPPVTLIKLKYPVLKLDTRRYPVYPVHRTPNPDFRVLWVGPIVPCECIITRPRRTKRPNTRYCPSPAGAGNDTVTGSLPRKRQRRTATESARCGPRSHRAGFTDHGWELDGNTPSAHQPTIAKAKRPLSHDRLSEMLPHSKKAIAPTRTKRGYYTIFTVNNTVIDVVKHFSWIPLTIWDNVRLPSEVLQPHRTRAVPEGIITRVVSAPNDNSNRNALDSSVPPSVGDLSNVTNRGRCPRNSNAALIFAARAGLRHPVGLALPLHAGRRLDLVQPGTDDLLAIVLWRPGRTC